MTPLLDAGSLSLLARRWHNNELHLGNKQLMHTVGWPTSPSPDTGSRSTDSDARRVLQWARGLHSQPPAHVILVGDVSPHAFDIIPAVPLRPSAGVRFEDRLSTCVIERPRHTVFSHTWDRQLLNLSYIFDAALANGGVIYGDRTLPFVDFGKRTVTIAHKFVSDVCLLPLACCSSLIASDRNNLPWACSKVSTRSP